MSKAIKVDGVYDLETLEHLHQLDIEHISFDLRPKSLNFLQQHRLMEIVKHLDGCGALGKGRYFLHFADEQEFVIAKFIEDLEQFFERAAFAFWGMNKIFLEFSDCQEASFYEQFGQPFFWHYTDAQGFSQVASSPLLAGLVLTAAHLRHQREELCDVVLPQCRASRWELVGGIGENWDWKREAAGDFFESLKSAVGEDMSLVSLPINRSVEHSYRRVNTEEVTRRLSWHLSPHPS